MKLKNTMVAIAIGHCKSTILFTILLAVLAGSFFPQVQIDTDPEHMLPTSDPSRVFHNQAKKTFALSEIVVLGIVNEGNPDGVFNQKTLGNIYTLAEYAKTLRWENPDDPEKSGGVISVDMIAPSLVEHISQAGPGTVSFDWLMPAPPSNREESLGVRERIMSNPMLADRMASEDGKAICLYLPLTDKHLSYKVYTALNEKVAQMGMEDEVHITGLPVAQDAIGVEMFTEMMVSSPLAMGTIFLLLFFFFRKLSLTILPMIIATLSVVITMGFMIGTGFKVHIMSSMIPVFLMSISVVDSIHILSEFFDSYTVEKGRKETIRKVLETLFMPMLYTSLTSAAGFMSLALTPIPPVQVFGVFVGAGIMIAWLLTILFVPAYIMVLPQRAFANFGLAIRLEQKASPLSKLLVFTGKASFKHAKSIVALLVVLVAISAWGITKIRINDNPVKWFATSHPIRKADTALTRHFSGTYPAYLILEGKNAQSVSREEQLNIIKRFTEFCRDMEGSAQSGKQAGQFIAALSAETSANPNGSFLDAAIEIAEKHAAAAKSDEDFYVYEEFANYFSLEKEKRKPFKQPEVLRYVARLQQQLQDQGLVGKGISSADVVSKINQEMIDGKLGNYRVPDTLQGVGECYMQFQQSHRPHDLWHFVTPDYNGACVLFQLASGDNKDMEAVERYVNEYFSKNPPPVEIEHRWAGLTYINVAWQNQMVEGMLRSFVGSFGIVLLMTVFLFRSVKWGLLCMIPLTITIAMIYGFIGIIGKDYDMPVAVLGVLTLGMSVDFAIHFVERCRSIHSRMGSWERTVPRMFAAPARAISRNVLVISIGFLPLLVSSLVPYQTTSLLLSSIMMLSGALTLVAMPAIITLATKLFFPGEPAPRQRRSEKLY
ncbi:MULTISPECIES: MMPL family transporter [unclassified Pseudodesulfovibrio]|uniref:efflux RND transporter permease subunit n=1 Tax=unclassified Pseudodesulfovibrio TaxID=2661612 RepID=UPI000FEBF8D6|nr:MULTISPECIES: MMPL family transporter [unclassified Pseudodesulfovibrio]MCJ2163536.1 MMPL family transporter [Pseudodesulfovibrio sp. S3-i]RWU06771.1 RND transporter [Pseudodesulfovibrio sp. S3]